MSHFWRKLKNGFTAVELAIVIAVIAILIAIIVPTFINILNSARKSNDSSMVYNANQTLQIEETLSGESYNNVTDAITTLLNNDYTLDDLTATADGCTLAYDTSTNSFVLLEDYTADGIDDSNIANICVVNPDSTTLTEAAENGITNFCVYDTSDTVTVETDLQVTFYVYTKENSTTTIDAASATVNYYGKSETVNITAVNSNSFHTYGTADTINLTKGHIEFCDGSETGTFNILGTETWYTFSGNASIGETIYKNNNSTYIPSKINYNGGNTDINLYTRPAGSYDTATEIAKIAAALYPYGVSYRANEDEATITLNYNYDNIVASTTTTTSSDDWKVPLTEITREGYRFDGWYLDSDCIGTQVSSGATIKSDLTLYAKWTEIYNVTFNLNYDGKTETTTPAAQTIIAGNTATEPESPLRTAYNFTGWYTDSGCTTAYNFSKVVEADITLYAGWEIKTYTVNFYNEYTYSDTYSAIYSLTIEHSESIATELLSTYIPNAVGSDGTPYYPNGTEDKSKTFDGWYTDSNFTTKFEFGTKITSNMDIYANWVDVNVTITLELNGGTLNDDTFTSENEYTATVIYGSTVDITTPEKSENEFLGWYTDANCTQKFTMSSTTVTENITLYAGWECSTATINGVTYTRVTLDGTTSKTFGTTNTVTVNNITKYWVITGYETIVTTDNWLILENEINGYPVLEIAAGALANASLVNVLAPENIVMVGSRAFLDNKGITSIVFLADEVYFSNLESESYNESYYNNVKADTDFWGNRTASKNYPFYGCGIDTNNTTTNLTVYYKTAYSTNCTVSDDTITLNGGVFVINNSNYVRTANATSGSDSTTINTITWLYINTTTITQPLKCGEYERGDFDWASALTDAVKDFAGSDKFNISYCCYGDYVFIATDLTTSHSYTSGGETITSTLSDYITDYLENAINSFTAEYGEYINGYTLSIGDSGTDFGGCVTCGNSATGIKIDIEESTKYYLVNLSQYLTAASDGTTTAWTGYEYSVDTTDGAAITYSYTVDGKAITVTAQFTGNVEYFTYDEKYSTYYGEACGEDLYAADDITITGSSKYNYELTDVNGATTTKNDDGTFTYEITISEVTDIALGWIQTDAKYINIVSGIDFTIDDGQNPAAISKSADGTTGDTLFYTEVANKKDGTLNDCEITTEEKGYYFLGWAYMNGESFEFTSVSITNPDEDGDSVFNNSATYYAIWGYWDYATDSNCTATFTDTYTVATSGNTLPAPSDDSFTFFNWYTDSKLTGGTALTSGTIIYYAKAAASSVTVNYVTYTFTKADSFSYGASSSDTIHSDNASYYYTNTITVDGGYYSITGHDTAIYSSDYAKDSDDWLVLKNQINNFKVLEIAAGAFASNASTGSLKNVIVPDNIVMVGYRAFLDNKELKTVVFLTDTIFFSSNYNGVTNYTNYNSSNDSQNYPFYGCTSMNNGSADDSTTNLNVYYNNAYSSNMSSGADLNGGTFIVHRNNSSPHVTATAHAGGTWLYIDTAIGTTTIAGSTFELDNALIAALEDYATTNSITYYQNGDYLFIAASDENLINSVASYITSAIDDFSAQYGSYINGHTVEVETDESDDYNLSVNVGDNDTAYYLVEIEAYISEEAVTATAAITNNTDNDGNIISVTYTNKVTGENETTTYTFTVTISNAEYFADNSGLYVKNGLANITASSDKNTHYLSSVTYGETTYTYATDGSTSGGIALDGSAMEYSVEVAFGAATGTLSLGWIAVEYTSTITIYSAVAATVGSGDTSLSKTEGNTLYSTELTMDTAYSYGNGSSTSGYYVPKLTTTENNYYFLGYAAYLDSDNNLVSSSESGATLTFTEIAVNNDTFNDSNTYYAIWGYSSETIDKSNTKTKTGSNELATPTLADDVSSGASFTAWYTDKDFTSSTISTLQSNTYIYYARMQYNLGMTFNGKNTKVTLQVNSVTVATATRTNTSSNADFYFSDDYQIIMYEGDTFEVTVESSGQPVTIVCGNTTYKMYAAKGSDSGLTNSDRGFNNNSNHDVTYTEWGEEKPVTVNSTTIYANSIISHAISFTFHT